MGELTDKLTNKDIQQIEKSGRSIDEVLKQAQLISQGKNYLHLVEPATVENGRIKKLPKERFDHLESIWKKRMARRLVKFVPASGAATRMFKALNFVYSKNFENVSDITDKLAMFEEGCELDDSEREEFKNLSGFKEFCDLLPTFPFYDELSAVLKANGIVIDEEREQGRIQNILRYLLTDAGMNYSKKPKLFLTFHVDGETPRLAMEEHIKEALWLTGGSLHFTVMPDHLSTAEKLTEFFTKAYREKGFEIDVSFSVQEPLTDTIALELDGSDFHRNPDGTLFFRQSGHGALSLNLDRMNSDYILLQNVDNLPGGSDDILRWKRAFMGFFASIEERVSVLARVLADEAAITEGLIEEAHNYITQDLNRPIDRAEFESRDLPDRAKQLLDIVNRPLVLAAMVPNKGEPGGGPFAVKDPATGLAFNQIVEGAQQNRSDPGQEAIVNKATHFNPVFMIMNTRDAWGKKFDLRKYAKREGGYVFYVEKSDSTGKEFASIDTGLWNGEIADMLIIFVEMPIETFGPAKTVLDLSPDIRPFRKNPYPEILPAIPHSEVLKIV